MSDTTISLTMEADVSKAVSAIIGASDQIAGSLKQIENSQSTLNQTFEQSVAPLTAEEQAQLSNAGAAVALKDAQDNLRAKQDQLNTAIKQYGTDSQQASVALRELNSAQQGVGEAQTLVATQTQRASISYKDLAVSISGVATAGFSLYMIYESIEKSALRQERASIQLKAANNIAQKAQEAYNDAVSKFGVNSSQAQQKAVDLGIANERASYAAERASQAEADYSASIARGAISILPTVITMTASLASLKGILTTATAANSVANTAEAVTESASSVAKTAAIPPTIGLGAAMWALTAAILANPITWLVVAIIGLVAAFIAAYTYIKPFHDAINALGGAIWNIIKPAVDWLIGGLTWLWNNVLVPLGEFIYNSFIKYLEGLAAGFKIVSDAIGGALNWLGDQWAKATGTFTEHVENGMKDQLKAVEDGLKKQTEEVKKKYAEQTKAVDQAYSDQKQAVIDSWSERFKVEEDGWSNVTSTIDSAYQKQVDAVDESCNSQLDTINAFYDDMISITQNALDEIRGKRDDENNQLELTYLLEKEAIENAMREKVITMGQGTKQLEDLETMYRTRKADVGDRYRIQELQAEIANKNNTEKAEQGRADATQQIEQDRLTQTQLILKEKGKVMDEFNAERLRVENKHTSDLAAIETARNKEILALETQAQADRLAIIKQGNSDIAAEYARQGKTSPPASTAPIQIDPNTSMAINPSTGLPIRIPGRAKGGLITSPEVALIGEAGDELLLPMDDPTRTNELIARYLPDLAKLNESTSLQSGGSVAGQVAGMQTNTIYVNVHIGNVSVDIPLEEVTKAVSRGIGEGLTKQGVLLS